jgi:hypothetical protein
MSKKKKTREPDIVSELQEDARWSSYTNTTVRGPGRIRGGTSGPSPEGRAVMRWIAFLILAALIAAILVEVVRAALS